MAKDPAFLFYSADFRQRTILLTDEQVGQYIRLLCDQHQNGHLPEYHMLNICKTYDSPVLLKFKKDKDGLFFNSRLDIEIEKRTSYCHSRRNNRLSKKDDKHMNKHMLNHMYPHMENENENRNDNTNENGINLVSGDRGMGEGGKKKECTQACLDCYSAYPASDPNNNGRSTGKGSKDKEKIEKLLRAGHPVFETIQVYVRNCKEKKSWLKNFGTFLNNMPDLEELRSELANNQPTTLWRPENGTDDPKRV